MASSDEPASPDSCSPLSARCPSSYIGQTQRKDERPLHEEDISQGRILWLPAIDELPERSVKRAHGKGAVDEGIYNHPVVVLSRPALDCDVVHFHLITSFQGKKLHEIYSKANEFHASRRSWYLPVAPSPPHPDANSKKSKKRFPTLELDLGALLRWNSYVNLRHVYKVHWTNLQLYANPDIPGLEVYRFERESMIRMLSKSKFLTGYETGAQYQRIATVASPIPNVRIPTPEERCDKERPFLDASSLTSSVSASLPLETAGFLGDGLTPRSESQTRPDPDTDARKHPETLWYYFQLLLEWPRMILKTLWTRLRRQSRKV